MTKIKICGITNLPDARVATEAGADLLGFIFYKPSPRYVEPDTVKTIVVEISALASARRDLTRPQFVGVFVNASRARMQKIFTDCRLDRIQLHGEEPPDLVAAFEGQAFKAMRPQSAAEAEALINTYASIAPLSPPHFLIDAYHPSLYGGTGRVTDWSMAAGLARRFPIMLAGSLTAANVAEAIAAVRPWGVDVSSGVEAEKGRKDQQKLRAFAAAVRHGL